MNMRPMNVRISAESLELMVKLSERLGMSQSEVIRLAMAIGLEAIDGIEKSPAELMRQEIRRVRSEHRAGA